MNSRPERHDGVDSPQNNPVIGLSEFRRAVLELGLVEAQELDRMAALVHGEVPRLALALVRAGKLTSYQAGVLARGKRTRLLVGNYLVLDNLGQGGMGVVLKARDRRSGWLVALKILPPALERDREAVQRFRREVEVAARLDHPNIVAALDASEDRGVYFLVMEYIEGQNLEALVAAEGPLPVDLAVHCVIQAARGMEAAHDRGIVHRDIKPANLMLDASGVVRVLDLGLARLVEATTSLGQAADRSLTRTGAMMGTVDYIAPEQADDAKRADYRADIYSLGCTLYFLLTGRPPFEGQTKLKKLMAHQSLPAPSLHASRSDVPEAVEAAYLAMMSKRPADRPQSMTAVIGLLDACLTSSNQEDEALASLTTLAGMGTKHALLRTRERESEPPVWAGRDEPVELGFDPRLEDLVTDHADELPETILPPLPRLRARSRPRFPAMAGVGAIAVLAICVVGYTLIPRGSPNPSSDQGQTESKSTTKDARAASDGSQVKTPSMSQATDSQSITNSLGMKLVLIPAGEFLMGSPESDLYGLDVEKPQHRVRITRPFYLGTTEVTQSQYETVMGSNPSHFSSKGAGRNAVRGLSTGQHPVENVSWLDAVQFCNALSGKEGLEPFYRIESKNVLVLEWNGTGYRLPTEAEWEYACRAGTRTTYNFGDDSWLLNKHAWLADNSGRGAWDSESFEISINEDRDKHALELNRRGCRSHPVGEKPPNPWGLYDMHGNVYEWCWDSFDPKYYISSLNADPRGPEQGADRVLRGGCFGDVPANLRSGHRIAHNPAYPVRNVGLRVTRSTDPTVTFNAAPPGLVRGKPAGGSEKDQNTARSPLPLKLLTNTLGMRLVLIPAGKFLMGSPESDPNAQDDEKPQHRVRITRPFYLGTTEVTVGQFRRVIEPAGYRTDAEQAPGGGFVRDEEKGQTGQGQNCTWRNPGFTQTEEHPVVVVSWNDAIEFCNLLSQREGLMPYYPAPGEQPGGDGYRLPTEAEWEYACRAGTTTRYYSGDDPETLAAVGNVRDAAARQQLGSTQTISARDGYTYAAPVGRFQPNAFGLFDMHGNVAEWCWDRFQAGYYRTSPLANPPRPRSGATRVLRGGSWFDFPNFIRSACRYGLAPGIGNSHLGFRVARSTRETLAPITAPSKLVETNPAEAVSKDRATARASRPAEPLTKSLGMKLVLIPAGEFLMGSPESDPNAQDNEKPQHRVRITRPFYLGTTEVTVGQLRRIIEPAGYQTDGERDGYGGAGWENEKGIWEFDPNPNFSWRNPGFSQTDEHPVVNVTWNDAIAFCNLLSRREGLKPYYRFGPTEQLGGDGYRLPTEAEWEYACRAGTTTRFFSGDDPETLAAVGNVADASLMAKFPHKFFGWNGAISARDGYVYTAPVGRFRPNKFGLSDMHGNAWEWCWDSYQPNYYRKSPRDDPHGPLEADFGEWAGLEAGLGVVRGGGIIDGPPTCRSAKRWPQPRLFRSFYVGFRVARTQSGR